MKKNIILAVFAAVLHMGVSAQWQSLFNGKNLEGWSRVDGAIEFKVEDGAIVGISAIGTPNTFLRTDKEYGDFILEMLFKGDDGLNSGVQFRGLSTPVYKRGRVHGYQYEIDPSPRAWTGGIYDEARSGWLYPLTINPAARKAYHRGEWNKLRIEAIGNRIRTWINDVPAADLLDAQTASGFIALQMHSITKEELAGRKVYWKDIRILTTGLDKEVRPETDEIVQINAIPNTISEREKAEGWKLLWDGKTTDGWISAHGGDFPSDGWSIRDGILTVGKTDGTESGGGGDIMTRDKYRNFMLTVEFKITKGANSGIKYFVNPEINSAKEGSAIGCEYQIVDDKEHPDAKLGVNGNRRLGALYDLIPVVPKYNRFLPGFFNKATIVVKGNHVEHWLNDVKLLEYDRNNPKWNELVSHSKYKDWKNFGNFETGHILLQDHGDQVHFKNIKIKILE